MSSQILEDVGLMEIITLAASESTSSPSQPMSEGIGLEQETVEARINHFYSSLYTPTVPTFDEIESATIRDKAKRGVIDRVVEAYGDLYQRIMDPSSKYEAPESFLKMSPAQVNALLV